MDPRIKYRNKLLIQQMEVMIKQILFNAIDIPFFRDKLVVQDVKHKSNVTMVDPTGENNEETAEPLFFGIYQQDQETFAIYIAFQEDLELDEIKIQELIDNKHQLAKTVTEFSQKLANKYLAISKEETKPQEVEVEILPNTLPQVPEETKVEEQSLSTTETKDNKNITFANQKSFVKQITQFEEIDIMHRCKFGFADGTECALIIPTPQKERVKVGNYFHYDGEGGATILDQSMVQ